MALTYGEHEAKIARQWDSKVVKMNWLGLEDALRGVLLSYKEGLITDGSAVWLMDQYIGAFTKRGTVLDD